MSKYLYGASVQGIQDFIFKTNTLREIVGASEIVKNISNDFLRLSNADEQSILVNAAGNIKAVFEDKAKLETVVNTFAKQIMQKAFGISISQAVVKIDGDTPTKEDFSRLESRLKIQRSKVAIPLDMSINIMELSPRTAKPAVARDGDEAVDKSSKQKRDANARLYRNNTELKELKEISQISNTKNKIAVIHADGNGLGAIIPNLGGKLSEFSKKLDEATKKAFEKAKGESKKIRPIILGGDDMTVICDANDALEFTKNFLLHFEEQTEKHTEYKLTACAGIAFCNEKYPFHYAVHLAEQLCSIAKKDAKKIDENKAPSSVMFHNIQSSNFQSWEKFVTDELTIKNDKETIRCDFGPYYLHKQNGKTSIVDFQHLVYALAQKNSPISSLRKWLGELHKSADSAERMIRRIDEMAEYQKEYSKNSLNNNLAAIDANLSLKTPIVDGKTPIYDVLQILSVTEGKL